MKAYVVIENGPVFEGTWLGGDPKAGEIVFNTSHNGYEEIATDPSYYGQIMVMSAPQQGNYGVSNDSWESKNLWIQGFVALEVAPAWGKEESWLQRLVQMGTPVIQDLDTRSLVLYLREQGTQIAALVPAESEKEARVKAEPLCVQFKDQPKDWVYKVSQPQKEVHVGQVADGPKVAVLDFGSKTNIIRELQTRCQEICTFPSRTSAAEILAYKPDGVLLSNGPGNPEDVESAVDVIKELLGQQPVFGICMGHQLLGLALGFQITRLKFGHRGANHPVKNFSTGQVYMTSQNHGYALSDEGAPENVTVTHRNLNDQTISGIECLDKKCFSVQFHPESHPGPREASMYFDQFVRWTR